MARRRRRGRVDPGPEGLDTGPPGRLVVDTEWPPIEVTQRSPARALDFFRVAPGHDPWPSNPSAVGAPALQQSVDAMGWYHTIDLPDGVVTPGEFDHRELLAHYPLPPRLDGLRALDVATFDGFWAFELERRGAEVTAIDVDRVSMVDLPAPAEAQRRIEDVDAENGGGFRLARDALGSRVRRVGCSVYSLDPTEVGSFDFVHVSDLLVHLRSPIEALAAIRGVTTGHALITDVVHPGLAHAGKHLVEYLGGWNGLMWWVPSVDALAQMVLDAGFADVELKLSFNLARRGDTHGLWRASLLAGV